nr:sugar transport protein 8-like [Ipomoea batatas]
MILEFLVVPLFISEIAPANRRSDDLSTFSFNVLITIGSLLANIVNFLSSKYVPSNGWRVSFGIAAVPAIFAVVAIFGANYFGRRSLLIACIPGCVKYIYWRPEQVAVRANMIFTFIVAQTFLTMLCTMKSGIFFMFASFVFVVGLFVVFLLPETKGIPIDEMKEKVSKKHWF